MKEDAAKPETASPTPCGWRDKCCGGDPRGCWQPGQEAQREAFEKATKDQAPGRDLKPVVLEVIIARRAEGVMMDPADLALIASMTPAQLLAAAKQDDDWADHVVRVGRWPSERNGAAVVLWRARAAACREAAADGR